MFFILKRQNHKITSTKYEVKMIFKLKNLAEIRTGIVVARKKANAESENKIEYPLINLKCISENGKINLSMHPEVPIPSSF